MYSTPERLDFEFQFTHPARGATQKLAVGLVQPRVSIHAPREGCDQGEFLE